ncbi:MAG: RsmF rRNA methyltransferase first C-terminal domain-containing protein [Bacillaceae bacterium]|nr:RsmF rRNA methyltransferase first C-terminal domain-containing protein [Bacillaceae bacterium]
MNLPEPFTARMKELLADEYDAFLQSLSGQRRYGLRINTLKISTDDFKRLSPFTLKPIPWTRDGFYYQEDEVPGKHPYYHAGLYYIQEPSAMFPAEVLDARPGERILDLCAAPGGKTVQIAAGLKGAGVLVTNDIHPRRVKALVKNIELYGIKNAIVTNETPDRLSRAFPGFFDKILIDAPCSGEGMFRKDPDMIKSWNVHSVASCCVKQQEILQHVSPMLKPGGKVIYATCTFAPEENEQMIAQFIREHPEFRLLDIPKNHGMAGGRGDWLDDDQMDSHVRQAMSGTVRLWPHRLDGEGHFVALLEKQADTGERYEPVNFPPVPDRVLEDYHQFVNTYLTSSPQTVAPDLKLLLQKDRLFLVPADLPSLHGLKVARSGWFLGTLKKKRFEPSHALLMGLDGDNIKQTLSFSADDDRLHRYLRGETLAVQPKGKGWHGIEVDGYPLGWAKAAGEMLKNHYPPGWRMM